MSSLCCVEHIEATAMLQENNNNNYSCLGRAYQSRESLQKRERGILPFAKLLEMGSFPVLGEATRRAPVRGFKAWAMSGVCARSRRWATLASANPAPFLKSPTESHAAGGLHPQMGPRARRPPSMDLQLEAGSLNRPCGSRQGTLGALVTVATLKASETGGQMQTQCFLLQAKGHSYLCPAGRRRAPPPGLFAQQTSAPAAYGLGEAASSEKPSVSGKASRQREGKDKPRPVRKWRTSCEVAFAVKEPVPGDCDEKESRAPGGNQENRSELASQSSAQDTQTHKQESPDAEISKAAKVCTQCNELRESPVIGIEREEEDGIQSNGGVEEEMTLPSLGSFLCRLDSDPTDLQSGCCPPGQGRPTSSAMQDGLPSRSSPQKVSRFQDLLGDRSPRLGAGGKSEVNGGGRNAVSSEEDLTAGAEAQEETGSPPDKASESGGGGGSRWCAEGARGRSPYGHITAEVPQSLSCEGDGPGSSTVRWTHPATSSDRDSASSPRASPEQPSDGEGSGGAGRHKARRLDGTGIREGVGITRPRAESPDSAGNLPISSARAHTGVERSCEVGESGPSDIWGGGQQGGRDGPEAAGQSWGAENGDPILQPDNSLSRGLDSAAVKAHAPSNLAPAGAMATALSSLDGWQGGALPGEPQQDWKGGMGASGEGLPDVEWEGDDEFGVFVQAGEQPSWDECFTDLQQVPYGTESVALEDSVREREPAHWISGETENPPHQSDDTWTAFTLEGSFALEPGGGGRQPELPGGQWWPDQATEETSVKLCAPFPEPCVLQEAFPPLPPSGLSPSPVLTLRRQLQALPSGNSSFGDSGSLLDSLQDVNRIIGLKYKWAESHSQKLLLQSLHLDTHTKGHVTSS